jgi:hypothetical protein
MVKGNAENVIRANPNLTSESFSFQWFFPSLAQPSRNVRSPDRWMAYHFIRAAWFQVTLADS